MGVKILCWVICSCSCTHDFWCTGEGTVKKCVMILTFDLLCMQDFFQMLRPGLQLLRPPKKDARDGPGVVAGFVAYNSDAFREEFGIEPWQACSSSSFSPFSDRLLAFPSSRNS